MIFGKKVVFTGVAKDRGVHLALLTTDHSGTWDVEKFTWRASVLSAGDELCV